MGRAETVRDRLPRLARVAGGWTGLRTWGVEVDPSGALVLARLPGGGTPGTPAVSFDPGGPGGLAEDRGGFGFVSDPFTGKVLAFTPCEPIEPGPGRLWRTAVDTEFCPGRFITPRGLALGPRGRLYVADAGIGAVLVLDPATGATLGSWLRVEPWQVLAEPDRLVVLDRGNPGGTGRVTVMDADGQPDAGFAPGGLADPIRIALAGDVLAVVDREPEADRVVLLDTATGAEVAGWRPVRGDPRAGQDVVAVGRVDGLAVVADRVFLVDAARGDLLAHTLSGEFVGSVRADEPLADVLAASDAVWTAPAAGGSWLRHDPRGRSRAVGTFTLGPLDTATERGRRELHARMDRVPGQHVRLWTTPAPAGLIPDPATLPSGADAVAGTVEWAALPADVEAALVPLPSGPLVCIGGELSGDGTSSPTVQQLAIGGGGAWLDLLPAIYRKDAAGADFLDRLLRLLQSAEEETEAERRALPARFDAWAAPDDPAGSALEDLAAWVATGLDERWADGRRRRAVARAHAAQAVRGTPLGLADAIKEQFGVRPRITSAAQDASVWSLGQEQPGCGCHDGAGGLGFTSMLAAAPPEGAVLGAGAAVDGSHLLGGERLGVPLFADLAHRFHVEVPAAAVEAGGGEAALRALIDQERPAHTAYTLCLVGPHARVGMQSRIGVDLIVGGGPAALRVGAGGGLGDAVLAGRSARVGKEHIA